MPKVTNNQTKPSDEKKEGKKNESAKPAEQQAAQFQGDQKPEEQAPAAISEAEQQKSADAAQGAQDPNSAKQSPPDEDDAVEELDRPVFIRLTRDVALGCGTRKRGTVLARADTRVFDHEAVECAPDIERGEVEIALNNQHLIEVVDASEIELPDDEDD